jgi:hypothetical protein
MRLEREANHRHLIVRICRVTPTLCPPRDHNLEFRQDNEATSALSVIIGFGRIGREELGPCINGCLESCSSLKRRNDIHT